MLARTGLSLCGPAAVELGGASVTVGRVGVLLLAALGRGVVSARSAKWRLWDDPNAPDNRLRQAVVRINRKLGGAGWRWRVRLDSGNVVLMPEPSSTAELP